MSEVKETIADLTERELERICTPPDPPVTREANTRFSSAFT
jgi:hypothetical protein